MEKKKETERDRVFMKDKRGMPMNKAVQGNNPKKYGVFGQH